LLSPGPFFGYGGRASDAVAGLLRHPLANPSRVRRPTSFAVAGGGVMVVEEGERSFGGGCMLGNVTLRRGFSIMSAHGLNLLALPSERHEPLD